MSAATEFRTPFVDARSDIPADRMTDLVAFAGETVKFTYGTAYIDSVEVARSSESAVRASAILDGGSYSARLPIIMMNGVLYIVEWDGVGVIVTASL